MSYAQAIARVSELREKIGMTSNIRTIGSQGFDEVLATAKNRFGEGPTRIVTSAQDVPRNEWGNTPNEAAVASRIRPLGGSAGAGIAGPGFATPGKVNGWSPDLKKMVDVASERFGVPRELVIAVSRAESAFRSDVTSPAGAKGLMQLMPATAKGLGVTNTSDPWQNLAGGTKYLRQLMDRFDGDLTKVIAGYNAGPNAVAKHGGIPPYAETQTYVARVLKYAGELGFPAGKST
ncbi:MAG: lytic transglycosylase domain-containing protein [Gaiellales bacterium]